MGRVLWLEERRARFGEADGRREGVGEEGGESGWDGEGRQWVTMRDMPSSSLSSLSYGGSSPATNTGTATV